MDPGAAYDLRAFAIPVTGADKRAFSQDHPPRNPVVDMVVFVAGIAVPAVLFVLAIGAFIFGDLIGDAGVGVVFLAFFMMSLVLTMTSIMLRVRRSRMEARGVRLTRFAADNGFTYLPFQDKPAYDGLFFKRGYKREVTDALRYADGSYEAGNLMFVDNTRMMVGSGHNNSYTIRRGYARVALPAAVPHLFLIGQHGAAQEFFAPMRYDVLNFPAESLVSLEGDFDSHFKTYAPEGMNVDARVVLTPDIMQILIGQAAGCDIEIIDNTLYVYAKTIDFDDAQAVGRILGVARTLRQTFGVTANPYIPSVAPAVLGTPIVRQQHLARRSSWIVGLFVFVGGIIYTISWVYGLFHPSP